MGTKYIGYLCSIILNKHIMSELIERVVEEIKLSIQNQDVEALEELLSFVPRENLVWFLPEEEWEIYENYMK